MAQGRSRWCAFGGEEVDYSRLRQYIKRTKALGDRNGELLAQIHALGRFPAALVVDSPTVLAAPGLLRHTEQGLTITRDYINGSLLSGCWSAASPADISKSTTAGDAGRINLGRFHDMASIAINLISPSSLAQCTALLRVCLHGLQDILVDQDPFLITDMIDIIYHLHVKRLTILKAHCLRHFRNLSTTLLGPGHPVSRLWKALADADAEDQDQGSELLVRVFQVALDQFSATLGRDHATTLLLNATKFNLELPGQSYGGEEEWARGHLARLEELNILDGRWVRLQHTLARTLFCQGKTTEAWTIVNGLLGNLRLATFLYDDPFQNYDFAILRAYMMRGENNREDAKFFFRAALSIAEHHQVKLGSSVLDALIHLEICLREWGDFDEADGVRKQRLDFIEGYIVGNGLEIGGMGHS